MEPPWKPSETDIRNFGVAVLLVATAFIGFNHDLGLEQTLFYLGVSGLVLLTRETGIRVVAQWIDTEVQLNLSQEGSAMTLLGGVAAYLNQWPVLLLFPIWTSFSSERRTQWGKSIDVLWLRRYFIMIMGGVTALFLGWTVSLTAGYPGVAEVYSLFLVFQLLPFDYSKIPTGKLDGAYILRHNGFVWIVCFGLAVTSYAVIVAPL